MLEALAAGDPQGVRNAPADAARPDLLDETLRVFQPRTARVLTREDAREIHQNLTGFFRVLLEWDARARLGSTPDPRSSE